MKMTDHAMAAGNGSFAPVPREVRYGLCWMWLGPSSRRRCWHAYVSVSCVWSPWRSTLSSPPTWVSTPWTSAASPTTVADICACPSSPVVALLVVLSPFAPALGASSSATRIVSARSRTTHSTTRCLACGLCRSRIAPARRPSSPLLLSSSAAWLVSWVVGSARRCGS